MQNRTKVILASTTAALVLATAIGVSKAREYRSHGYMNHDRHGMATQIFDRFDLDGNGAVSQAEVDGLRKSEIAKHDTDGNGKLNLKEFEALWLGYVRNRMVDHFQRLDSDGNAEVTDAEIARPLNMMMTWMDRNDDKTLTRDELRGGHRWGKKHRRYEKDDDDDRRKD
jgi:hypothetical protein